MQKKANVVDSARVDIKATGVRPADLAKYDEPFYIHSENPDSYVKYKTSKAYNGYVKTSKKGWSGGNRLFGLEDAGSGKYYIKAVGDSRAVVGYLYLSDKKTGVFKRLNNIMWSKEKKDNPNYKFEFQESAWQNSNYRIICNGKILIATTGFKRFLKATDSGVALNEAYFELNMPVSISHHLPIDYATLCPRCQGSQPRLAAS